MVIIVLFGGRSHLKTLASKWKGQEERQERGGGGGGRGVTLKQLPEIL